MLDGTNTKTHTITQKLGVLRRPPEVLRRPPEVLRRPPEVLTRPPEVLTRPPEVLTRPKPPQEPIWLMVGCVVEFGLMDG